MNAGAFARGGGHGAFRGYAGARRHFTHPHNTVGVNKSPNISNNVQKSASFSGGGGYAGGYGGGVYAGGYGWPLAAAATTVATAALLAPKNSSAPVVYENIDVYP
ncbi:hypothetical protein K737_300596 [Holospora undulata HU1]|uniref:Uncharacterized protein n=2 Tax=Holospora TaxID=44747 RepID=A0A061JGB7_9PROT|nr:hypothetical protein K737_300596 [Holospora undulata HU1]